MSNDQKGTSFVPFCSSPFFPFLEKLGENIVAKIIELLIMSVANHNHRVANHVVCAVIASSANTSSLSKRGDVR